MRRAKAGEDDQLHKQFHHLQQDWNSYKQSAPRRRRHCHRRSSSASTTDATPVPEFLRLLHSSPRKLISSLQGSRTPSARPRPVISPDAATERRRSAIKSGELRGRSLLEALESAKDEAGPRGRREDICSICSSALVQESGAAAVNSSSCSCCCSSSSSSSVDRYKRNRNACYICSSSNSSSSSYIEAALANNNNNKVAKDDEVVVFVSKRNEEKNIRINSSSSNNNNANANGEKWVVRVGWFALALVVLAFGLISYVEFGAEESATTVEYMIPT